MVDTEKWNLTVLGSAGGSSETSLMARPRVFLNLSLKEGRLAMVWNLEDLLWAAPGVRENKPLVLFVGEVAEGLASEVLFGRAMEAAWLIEGELSRPGFNVEGTAEEVAVA